MRKRKYTHLCNTKGTLYGRKRSTGKNVSPNHRSIAPHKKDIAELYNKFYRDQVAALYRAIRD
jgi:hypothetical protein